MVGEENKEQQLPSNAGKRLTLKEWIINSLVLLWAIASFSAIVVLILFNVFGQSYHWLKMSSSDSQLDVVATAHENEKQAWELTGIVVDNTGTPAVDTTLWAIATDSKGNRYMPLATSTDKYGQFTINSIPLKLDNKGTVTTSVVEVHAFQKSGSIEGRNAVGQKTLSLSNQCQVHWTKPSYTAIFLIAVIFGFSLITGYINPRPPLSRQIKYYSLVFLSFLFPFTMLVVISMALSNIKATGNPEEVISLGFANIYHGVYCKDTAPEWIFSFTSPSAVDTTKTITKGFGAPMWALFLSLIGGAAFTFSLLVKHVTKKVHWKDEQNNGVPTIPTTTVAPITQVDPNTPVIQTSPVDTASIVVPVDPDERMGKLLHNQFNTLFSPLSAVFVYQGMVSAGMAANHLVVALAMLGSGAVVTLLLNRAVKAAETILTPSEDKDKSNK